MYETGEDYCSFLRLLIFNWFFLKYFTYELQVMEYLNGGPLLDVVCSFVRYTEEDVKGIIFQLIE